MHRLFCVCFEFVNLTRDRLSSQFQTVSRPNISKKYAFKADYNLPRSLFIINEPVRHDTEQRERKSRFKSLDPDLCSLGTDLTDIDQGQFLNILQFPGFFPGGKS
jgi:hypothetical protein